MRVSDRFDELLGEYIVFVSTTTISKDISFYYSLIFRYERVIIEIS